VHDHAAQFRGVRGNFLCAEGFGISPMCWFMAFSLLHEGGGREDGREGGSEEASKHASDVRRSNEENEQETQEFLFVLNKKIFSSNKKINRPIKKNSSNKKFIFFVAIKYYFRVIKNYFIWAN
jgi:hypothetical protein